MGSIRITDSIERVGDATITKVEYEFSNYEDFAAWQADKNKALADAITNLTAGYGADNMGGLEPMVGEIKVAKKQTKH